MSLRLRFDAVVGLVSWVDDRADLVDDVFEEPKESSLGPSMVRPGKSIDQSSC